MSLLLSFILLIFLSSGVSTDPRDLSICYRRNGHWIKNTEPRILPWIRKSYGQPTICDGEFDQGDLQGYEADSTAMTYLSQGSEAQLLKLKDQWNVSSTLKWRFEMKQCTWQEFTYPQFCEAMRYRFKIGHGTNILFVGGDLMYGLERRIAYNMLSSKNGRKVLMNLFPDGCIHPTKHVGGCTGCRYCLDDDDIDGNFSVGLRYIRNLNLSLTSAIGRSSDERPWIMSMKLFPTQVLVLNLHSTELVGFRQFATVLENAISWAKNFNPNVTVLYVSTPILDSCPLKAHNAPPVNLSSLDPHDVKRQNSWAEKLVTSLGGVYVNLHLAVEAMPPALLRDMRATDGSACVPLCQPGIMDSWAAILYNTMLDAIGAVPTAPPAVSESEQLYNMTLSPSDYDASIEDQCERAPGEVPVLTGPLPGSRLRSEKEAESVRAKLDCFSNKGRWIYNATPRALPWPFEISGTFQCDKRHEVQGGMHGKVADMAAANGGKWAVREAVKWQWESRCPMEPFSLETFCRSVGPSRRILLLGDSLTEHFTRALLNNLAMGSKRGARSFENLFPDKQTVWTSGLRPEACFGYATCHDFVDKPVNVIYCYTHHLTLVKWPHYFEAPWVRKLKEWNPSIVLLNRGAWQPDVNTTFKEEVQKTLRYIRQELPDSLLIWRNSPHGHDNCSLAKAPLRQPETVNNEYWNRFAEENKIAAQLIHEVGGVLMDVDYMTILRPDGHFGTNAAGAIDCFHYCQPGPQDTWVQLLQNILKAVL